MRLLKDDGYRNLGLVEKHDNDIPRYAILSYTWVRKTTKSHLKTSRKAQVETRLAIRRLNSVKHKLLVIVCNIFGWTPITSINRAATSLARQLIRCFVGIKRLQNATYIYLISQRPRRV